MVGKRRPREEMSTSEDKGVNDLKAQAYNAFQREAKRERKTETCSKGIDSVTPPACPISQTKCPKLNRLWAAKVKRGCFCVLETECHRDSWSSLSLNPAQQLS